MQKKNKNKYTRERALLILLQVKFNISVNFFKLGI